MDGAPLDYAPRNELGVVFLFSWLARRRFGLRVERIQAGYPDCIAVRSGRRVRVEFEYRSHNFVTHRHDPRGVDWIVCWEHDWPAAPKRIRVVDLRRELGLGFNVWFQPVAGVSADTIAHINRDRNWSVARRASKGDLVLFYRTRPEGIIKDVFEIAGPVGHPVARWKSGKDYMAPIRRVCTLKAPIHLRDLQDHPILRSAGFVRGSMQGRHRASSYWPDLYRLILDRNPAVRRKLADYGPQRLA